jgi:Ser/Thr protein kinase RdoA (MazF antagonist)
VAEGALPRYGLGGAPLRLLTHRSNTLFAVGDEYVLRINRPDPPPVARLRGELIWLDALRHDTDLIVPEPVATEDGEWLIPVDARGLPAPRLCVLLRRVEGRFLGGGLTPAHLRRVGALQAALHRHAATWTPPAAFDRRRWDWRWMFDDLSVLGPSGAGLLSPEARAVWAATQARVAAEMAALEARGGEYGVIHADLQHTNYLFHGDEARAIDFADCCWGYFVYDMAIPLFNLAGRPDEAALRAAFFAGYSRVRPLPPDTEAGLRLFTALVLIKRVNYLARAADPALRSQAPHWLAVALPQLEAFLADKSAPFCRRSDILG